MRRAQDRRLVTQRRTAAYAFTTGQLDRLKRQFSTSKYLTKDKCQSLAAELQLSECQIKIWFQNKRARTKASGARNQLTDITTTELDLVIGHHYIIKTTASITTKFCRVRETHKYALWAVSYTHLTLPTILRV